MQVHHRISSRRTCIPCGKVIFGFFREQCKEIVSLMVTNTPTCVLALTCCQLKSSVLDTSGPFQLLNALRMLPPDGSHTLLVSFTPHKGHMVGNCAISRFVNHSFYNKTTKNLIIIQDGKWL